VATSFIAGFTIVFGVVALGIVHAMIEPRLGEITTIAGAVGVVFLVVDKAVVFNENFFRPGRDRSRYRRFLAGRCDRES
jgi:hypothetical protein